MKTRPDVAIGSRRKASSYIPPKVKSTCPIQDPVAIFPQKVPDKNVLQGSSSLSDKREKKSRKGITLLTWLSKKASFCRIFFPEFLRNNNKKEPVSASLWRTLRSSPSLLFFYFEENVHCIFLGTPRRVGIHLPTHPLFTRLIDNFLTCARPLSRPAIGGRRPFTRRSFQFLIYLPQRFIE